MFVKSLVSLSLAAIALGQATINTPSSLIVCQPAALSWSGGSAPYYVSILPGGQASGTPLEQLGSFTTTSTTWTVDIAAGTAVTLSITDASGVTNYSQQVTILAGTTTSCVGSGSAAAGANTSATAPASAASGSVVTTGAGSTGTRTPIKATNTASGGSAATSAASSAASGASSKASSAGSAATSAASAAASSATSSAGAVQASGFLAFLGAVFALVA